MESHTDRAVRLRYIDSYVLLARHLYFLFDDDDLCAKRSPKLWHRFCE